MDFKQTIDGFVDGVKEFAEATHIKVSDFHDNYISKIAPDLGKYGDVAKFMAEMAPGVSEYNAICEGDWQAFAIAAGIDIAAVVAGAFTAGTGYAVLKGGSGLAKSGVKVAVKEIAEAGTKKAVKEVAEAGTIKAVKEIAENGAEKAIRETVEGVAEKAVKETLETGSEKIVKETVEEGAEKIAKEGVEKVALEVGEKIDKTKFPEYMKQIEEITSRKIPEQQRNLLDKALRETDFRKLSKEARDLAVDEFNACKKKLIAEWEEKTGQKWPRYTQDIINEKGKVIRRKGNCFDAHHIIELSTSGPPKWWNIHPAAFPSEHQNGIHAVENLAYTIFGK